MTAYRTPYRTRSVVGEDFAAEKAVITEDMHRAQSLTFGPYLAFMANYGRIIRVMADAYESHEVAYGILQRHADAVLDEIHAEEEAATA
ncbi:hypothetical protein [Actinacidiphila glaucinigra]|uniref:Uncharacterized protein n=1 Tax=Actinacidiphila glaucinigra TaxID=235986 RepID=A0A239F1G7_9ACTN|nr:hypothetical protein [Actinacidiphila glaucinigra]SNS49992.1 hypothetical protein SAMN05216252_106232 [Actinacidiphila glaucinigra]